jgi:lysozyme
VNISTIGLGLIQEFEGCKLEAYRCPANILTIGIGHTRDVKEGDTITEAQALDLLREDVKWVENAINDHVKVKINQNQFDALSAFIFNVGAGAFSLSTLLRKLNAGDYEGAANEFSRWNKANGKELPGLTRRRTAEKALFLA